ncbi:MAG: transglycosylase SLT domain-containing protein [Rikenellaceae bacterium]
MIRYSGFKRQVTFAVVTLIVVASLVLFEIGVQCVVEIRQHQWESHVQIILDDLRFNSTQEEPFVGEISEFDELYYAISTSHGIDWRLMSAIGYIESRFNPRATSHRGAVGLMQIMPRTGRIFGRSELELLVPSINIDVANRYYLDIERMMKIPHGTSNRDCMALVLASYNGGVGHLFDAQRLTREVGGDPHKWEDVKLALLRLRYVEGYGRECVRFGSFRGARYTVAYVRDVLAKYDEYLSKSEEAQLFHFGNPESDNY